MGWVSLAIWCIPVCVALFFVVKLSISYASGGTVCPVCGFRFYSHNLVGEYKILPCGHKMLNPSGASGSTGPR